MLIMSCKIYDNFQIVVRFGVRPQVQGLSVLILAIQDNFKHKKIEIDSLASLFKLEGFQQ